MNRMTPSKGMNLPSRVRAPGSQTQAEEELGPRLAIYRGRPIGRPDILFVLLPGALGVLAPLGYGMWLASFAYTHYGPVAADQWSRPWFLLASAAVIAFAILVAYRLLQAVPFVAVHKEGVILHLNLLQTQTLRWTQISGIADARIRENFLGRPLRVVYRATLHPQLGKPFVLTENLQHLPELVSRLKASLYRRIGPALQAAYASGEWLYFGPVAIHLHALSLHDRQFSWSDIENINVRSGSLVILFKNRTLWRVPVEKIQNLEILMEILRQGAYA